MCKTIFTLSVTIYFDPDVIFVSSVSCLHISSGIVQLINGNIVVLMTSIPGFTAYHIFLDCITPVPMHVIKQLG